MSSFAPAVYILCLATSMLCAALLIRSYWRSKTQLLLWSAACFGLLAVNNLLVVFDLLVLTTVDLSLWRVLTSLAAVLTILYAFIFEID